MARCMFKTITSAPEDMCLKGEQSTPVAQKPRHAQTWGRGGAHHGRDFPHTYGRQQQRRIPDARRAPCSSLHVQRQAGRRNTFPQLADV